MSEHLEPPDSEYVIPESGKLSSIIPDFHPENNIRLGDPLLDRIFPSLPEGYIPASKITYIIGIPGSGKSTILHQLCMSCSLSSSCGGNGSYSMYIDCKNDFDSRRISNMAFHVTTNTTEASDCVKRITYVRITSIVDLMATCLGAASHPHSMEHPPHLIVIDGLLSLLEKERSIKKASELIQTLHSSFPNAALVVAFRPRTKGVEDSIYRHEKDEEEPEGYKMHVTRPSGFVDEAGQDTYVSVQFPFSPDAFSLCTRCVILHDDRAWKPIGGIGSIMKTGHGTASRSGICRGMCVWDTRISQSSLDGDKRGEKIDPRRGKDGEREMGAWKNIIYIVEMIAKGV
ncbi:hypothetical protein ADUPG1_008597 [Aduncisulcus paluster]|uniref:Rad51-like C-terminal domain-containing protein n=1 Tax=Aduncisulcus paluster TaxID=2918883 RepID=A0ABQ5KTW7_9EUKA|nr:hypothetical protein ADUPG1_008597 [Aduncisulcus paluster]